MDINKINKIIDEGNLDLALSEIKSIDASDVQTQVGLQFLTCKILYLNEKYQDCIDIGSDLISRFSYLLEFNYEIYMILSKVYAMTSNYDAAVTAAEKANSIIVTLGVSDELVKFDIIHTKNVSLLGLGRYSEAMTNINQVNFNEFNHDLRLSLISLKCMCLRSMGLLEDVVDLCLSTLLNVEGPITECSSVGDVLLNLGVASVLKGGIQSARKIKSILQKHYHEESIDELLETLPPFSIFYPRTDFDKLVEDELNRIFT